MATATDGSVAAMAARWWWGLAALAVLAGCGDDGGTPDRADTDEAPTLSPLQEELAADLGLTDAGRDLLADLPIEAGSVRAQAQRCPETEPGLVLGCIDDDGIFLLEVEDPRLDGMSEHSAAHLLLHAGFDELSDAERRRVRRGIRGADLPGEHLDLAWDQIADLPRDDRPREQFAAVGGSAALDDTDLLPLYERWFSDPSAIRELGADIRLRITLLENRAAEIRPVLTELNDTLEAAETELERRGAELDAGGNTDRAGVDAYNALVDQRNADAARFTELFEELEDLDTQLRDLTLTIGRYTDPFAGIYS